MLGEAQLTDQRKNGLLRSVWLCTSLPSSCKAWTWLPRAAVSVQKEVGRTVCGGPSPGPTPLPTGKLRSAWSLSCRHLCSNRAVPAQDQVSRQKGVSTAAEPPAVERLCEGRHYSSNTACHDETELNCNSDQKPLAWFWQTEDFGLLGLIL